MDVQLLTLLRHHARVGALELSRLAGVSRATVSARLTRLEEGGVITGYGPDVDMGSAGYPVQAFATLEIAQGRLSDVADMLSAVPNVLDAYATTGAGDVVCRLAAASNDELQQVLIHLNASDVVRRSISVVILSTLIEARTLPLLASSSRPGPRRTAGARKAHGGPAK